LTASGRAATLVVRISARLGLKTPEPELEAMQPKKCAHHAAPFLILTAALLVTPVLAAAAASGAPDPQALIKAAENTVKGKTAHGTIEMTVVWPDFTRSMRMETWWEGNDKALIIIQAPRKDAGNKTLKIGNEMWNYLKNTETTIKVPPSMMLQSWNGSDFTNDDLVRESNYARDYHARLDTTEEVEGTLCYKLTLKPRPDAPVVWGRLEYWIDRSDTLPVRLDYYDEEGNLKRHMVFSDVRQMGSRTIPTTWTMYDDTREGRHTTMKFIKMEFDIPISDTIFSRRELESGR
jgi:outer membrane lipoprotein-sorting protein